MIKVNKITIEEFRGIRSLSLDMNSKSYAICGRNGTGKSGVVDAVEFGLTGSISRLTGEGRGSVSVMKHGPHVDSSGSPEKARVTIEVFIPSLNKTAVIVRDVKNSRVPTITPNEPAVIEAFDYVAAHPEFVLSRREIIKYVLAEPGVRATEVQALLQLDDLGTARSLLQKISNASARELGPLSQEETSTRNALIRGMGVIEATPEAILVAANEKRVVLGLLPLPKLEVKTSLRDGMDSLASTTASRVNKIAARAEIIAAKESIAILGSAETTREIKTALKAVNLLRADESNLEGMSREAMLNSAIELFDEHNCPVCNTEWNPIHFRTVVQKQLDHLTHIVKERKSTEALLAPILRKFDDARSALIAVSIYGAMLVPKEVVSVLETLANSLTLKIGHLRRFLPLAETLSSLELDDTKKTLAALKNISRSVESIPDQTERDDARDYLTSANERLQAYRIAAAKFRAGERKADIAKRTFETFSRATDEALETIYEEVEEEFRKYYSFINSDDESDFEAKLTPSIGKLSFGVNFYGRGLFPPGAYHSEGHQDGMGLCLYLALMKHILGDGFTLAVLDDVLMSVDKGHRREVCRLLKTEFPNTQFILTTHDTVWLRHMKSAGLIESKSGVEFQDWDVNKGPTQWKDIDVWAEIDGYVGKNDIRAAASLLREHLEYISAEYCELLGGKVTYKGDNHYELGDFLPGAVSAMKDALRKAKSAAESWKDETLLAKVEERITQFDAAYAATQTEQWQINPAIHYNEWANLEKADFKPVVEAFKLLTSLFACAKCEGLLQVTRTAKGDKDSLRCPCPEINFTLLRKTT